MKGNKHRSRGVLGSLSTAVGRLGRNPVILVAALLVTLVSVGITLLGFVEPLLANLGSLFSIFVWPFLLAGLIGLIDEARTNRARLATLFSTGKSNYLSMLGGTLLVGIIVITVVFVSTIIAFVVLLSATVGATAGLTSGGVSLLLVAAVLLVFVPYFAVYLFVQFYNVGIVVGGESAGSSLSHSVSLVRQNVLGVVGYTIVFMLLQLIGNLPGYAVLFLGALELTEAGEWVIASESLFAASGALILVLGTITMALAFTYHVTFYDAIRSEPTGQSSTGDESVAV